MKYLGIDYGTKNVGVAVSDDEGVLAFPDDVFDNNEKLVERLARVIKERGIGAIVVGKSVDYDGRPNPLHSKALVFAMKLQNATGLTPLFHTEVLTSREAAHIQGETAMHDASAAAIMLQSYLDVTNRRLGIDIDE